MAKQVMITWTEARAVAGIHHICYEFVASIAGAKEMFMAHPSPVNILIQDATLMHFRAMAEFFDVGKTPVGAPTEIMENRPDLKAIYYSKQINWVATPFHAGQPLRTALDKLIAHLSLSRVTGDADVGLKAPWDGPAHLHGTVKLLLRTWRTFTARSLSPKYRKAFKRSYNECCQNFGLNPVGLCGTFDAATRARLRDGFRLNQRPT